MACSLSSLLGSCGGAGQAGNISCKRRRPDSDFLVEGGNSLLDVGECVEKGAKADYVKDIFHFRGGIEQFNVLLRPGGAVFLHGMEGRPAFLAFGGRLAAEKPGDGMEGGDAGAAQEGETA